MAKRILPTPEQLRELLRYDPETGKLYWKVRDLKWFKSARSCNAWNARYAGEEALTAINTSGYRLGRVLDRAYCAHRVIWAIHYGEWPEDQLDHVDTDKLNNRIDNLRAATQPENNRNKGIRKTNKSGFKGVHLDKRTGRWRAQITAYGKRKTVGTFNTPEAAHAAYCEAAKKYHGEFARTE